MKKILRIFDTARRAGLGLSDVWALILLVEHGPQPMSQIATHLQVTSAAMTQMIDKLVSLGLVARHPDAGDRRIHRIALTPCGDLMISGQKTKPENQTA